MGQLENWKMTPLDALLCNNQLQILKTLVFFFPPARQRQMIFLVKLLELRQCMALPLSALSSYSRSLGRGDPGPEMFEAIFPYCDHEKQQTFRQMQNAFQMMKTVQQFSDSGMFDNMSEMMGQMSGMDGFNMDAFANMTGMNMGAPDSHPDQSTEDRASAESSSSSNASHPPNDQLVSMLSSMMNSEQKELFSQYESMLDELETD